ncbi:hypothetical protein Hanom_Chr15g01359761 [Helianthus anomalus]
MTNDRCGDEMTIEPEISNEEKDPGFIYTQYDLSGERHMGSNLGNGSTKIYVTDAY